MDEKERARALDLALGQIEKQFGKGSILRLGSKDAIVPVSVISTGSISLDAALGVGGLPRGRVIEIFGPESSGKTTIALQVIAEAQKKGGIAAFIDVEHALDPAYARKLGVDIDNLLVSQPDYGEQALEITNTLTASGQIDVLVVDSVAALVPKSELDGEMGDSHMGVQARLMSQALRKLTGVVSKSRTCLIFINQIREKIGVMFGNPETTTGGRALKFYASVRLDIRRIAAIKDGEQVVGNRTKVKVVKNKVASPFREAEFDLIYGEGVSKEGDLLDLGVAQNIVEKSGSWFSYKGERIGQGRETARQFLKDNPDIRAAIDTELRKALGLIKTEPARPAPVESSAAECATSAARAATKAKDKDEVEAHERGGTAAGHRAEVGAHAEPNGGCHRDRLSRRWTRLSAWADCREDASSNSTDLLPAGRPLWRCRSSPRRSRTGLGGRLDRRRPFVRSALCGATCRQPGGPSAVGQPESAEEAMEVTRQLAVSGAVDLLVVGFGGRVGSPDGIGNGVWVRAARACRAACWPRASENFRRRCSGPAWWSCFSTRHAGRGGERNRRRADLG